MNAKELYLTIGQIGDDLILGANENRSKKKKPGIRLWVVAAAACFCLIIGGRCLHFWGTIVIWNTGATEYVTKSTVPENGVAQSLPAESLPDYYHIALPDRLGDLSRTAVNAQLYANADGSVLYDRNVLRYENADGSKRIALTLSRVSPAPEGSREAASRIHGVSVTLTEDASTPDSLLLSAQWEQGGTTVHLAAEGLRKEELITILKKLIEAVPLQGR